MGIKKAEEAEMVCAGISTHLIVSHKEFGGYCTFLKFL